MTDEKPAPTMSRDLEARQSPGLPWIAWLGLFLMLYVLSTGPLFKLARSHQNMYPSLHILYFPLIAASNASPLVNRTLDWYCKLWG